MTFNKHLFKSQRLDWNTPKNVYQVLDSEFNFDFDPCPKNPKFDGLRIEWGQRNFVNPPYGNEIIKWVKKGIAEHNAGKTVVFLVASRTDTSWFHLLMKEASEIRFIKGRLRFDDHDNSAPFPSVIIVLDTRKDWKS